MNVDDGSTVEFVVDNDAGDDDSNYNIMVVFFVISVAAIVFC